MFILAAFLGHPHPMVRAFVGVLMLGAVVAMFVGAIMMLATWRRQPRAELLTRMRSLEEKIDRLSGPAPK